MDLEVRKLALVMVRWLTALGAIGSALFVPTFKIYETGYAFREAEDPSNYDHWKDWFSTNEALPFHEVGSGKILMRLYVFVVPFMAASAFWFIHSLLPNPDWTKTSATTTATSDRSIVKKFRERVTQAMSREAIRTHPRLVQWANFPETFSGADLAFVVIFLLLNWLVIWSRIDRSLTRGAKKLTYLKEKPGDELIPFFSWGSMEILAKTLGVVSIMNLGWYLLFPIGRRSVLLEILHISWDSAIKYHRWIGYYTMVVLLLHSLMYVMVWWHGTGQQKYGDPDGHMLKISLLPGSCNDEICDEEQKLLLLQNVYGVIALFCAIVMTVFSLDYFRRSHFEWFYYTHHLFVFVFLFTCLHYGAAIIYLMPGLAAYTIDRCMRVISCFTAIEARAKISSPTEGSPTQGRVIELTVPIDRRFEGTLYEPGQYVFINVPAISTLQWHPITISSARQHAERHGSLTLHIKNLGDWSNALAELVQAGGSRVRVKVDGFFGTNANAGIESKYLCVIGGGIGITGFLGSLTDAVDRGVVSGARLIWSTRSLNEFHMFFPILKNIDCTTGVWFSQTAILERELLHEKNLDSILGSLEARVWESIDLIAGKQPGVGAQPEATKLTEVRCQLGCHTSPEAGAQPDANGPLGGGSMRTCAVGSMRTWSMPSPMIALVTACSILVGIASYVDLRLTTDDHDEEQQRYQWSAFIVLYMSILAFGTILVWKLLLRGGATPSKGNKDTSTGKVSAGNHEVIAKERISLHTGRVDVQKEVEFLAGELESGTDIVLQVCGLPKLKIDWSTEAMRKHTWEVRHEEWEW